LASRKGFPYVGGFSNRKVKRGASSDEKAKEYLVPDGVGDGGGKNGIAEKK